MKRWLVLGAFITGGLIFFLACTKEKMEPEGEIQIEGEFNVFEALQFWGDIPQANHFIWDFGNGSIEEVKYAHVKISHTYHRSGNFLVKLIGVTSMGNDTLEQMITIAPSAFSPVADALIGTYFVEVERELYTAPGWCNCPAGGSHCIQTDFWADSLIQVFVADEDSTLVIEHISSDNLTPKKIIEKRTVSFWKQELVGETILYYFKPYRGYCDSSGCFTATFLITSDSTFFSSRYQFNKYCINRFHSTGYKL